MPYGDRTITCNKGCGTTLKFDKNYTSQSGKMIPLEAETGQPHQCPNNTYNQKKNIFPSKQDTQELRTEIATEGQTQLKFAEHAEQIDQLLQQIVLVQEQQDLKLDKILEALTITTKAEFKPAADLKTNGGNEISGSDWSSGPGAYVQGGIAEEKDYSGEGDGLDAVQDTG
jgi:hypothetical protein